jgi:hypothetical protein
MPKVFDRESGKIVSVPASEIAGMVRVMGMATEVWMRAESGLGDLRSKIARLVCSVYANGIEVTACEEDMPEPGQATITFESVRAAEDFLSVAQDSVEGYVWDEREEPSNEARCVAAAVHFSMMDIPRLTEAFASLW